MTLHSVNPATGLVLRSYQETDAAAVEGCLVEAAEAQPVFAARDQGSRNAILNRAAELLESRAGEYARLMTLEMGKPIGAAEAEVAKCARVCRWYARHAERLLGDEAVATEASESFVRFEPLGVILAVMPWNFPFWQVFRFAAPAIAAGNAGLLKHASNVSGCAVAIEEVLRDAGAPRGIFQSLLIPSSRVEPLIRDPRVRAVTLTGSDPAGRAVAAAAGDSLKKTVLELGGSDPFIVCADADLARAIATAVTARTINNGQSCIAAKRFLVERSIADEFEAGFRDAMAALRMGDPLDRDVQIGPLATEAIRDELAAQVDATIAGGGRRLLGGVIPSGPGWFYPPTVVADPPPDTPLRVEESFGPAAAILRFDSDEEAVALANETEFGLAASVWSRNPERARRFVSELATGSVFVNAMVASDPRLPFGGIKNSGYGRELSGYGLREFLNVKTVWVES